VRAEGTVCHGGIRPVGRKLRRDPAAERFVDDPVADRYLTRPRREPWHL